MKDYSFISTMTYEELSQYVVACYYAGDHASLDMVIAEMKRRYPERYYDDLYNND